MSYLSDGDTDCIQMVLNTGLTVGLLKYLNKTTPLQQLVPILRIYGNLVTGTDTQTDAVINSQQDQLHFLPLIFQLLKHEKKPVRREVCWTLSNITAGNSS